MPPERDPNSRPKANDVRPPQTGSGEKATLLGFLDYLREAIATKAEGAPEPQVRTAGVPSGTSVLGLVKHLTFAEGFHFLGEDVTDWAATMRPEPEETVAGVVAAYRLPRWGVFLAGLGWIFTPDRAKRLPRPPGGRARRAVQHSAGLSTELQNQDTRKAGAAAATDRVP